MIEDGYKDFVNKSDVASVVKEYVAIIAVGISGAGNGKLCSQLNTAISFDEAIAGITVWIRQKQKISHRKPFFDSWKILHFISILGKQRIICM